MFAVVQIMEDVVYIHRGGCEYEKVFLKEKEFKFKGKNESQIVAYVKKNFPITCKRKIKIDFYK